MPTGAAPVKLMFCTRGPAATIWTVGSGVARGDADVSGDTDRDPEADAPSAYRGTS